MSTATQQVATGTQAPPTAPGLGHNSGLTPQAQKWLDDCTTYGETAGAGDTSFVGWLQNTVQAAFRDEIDPDLAEQGSKNYQEARRKRASMLGTRAKANDGKADVVRASECRKAIKLGKLAQFRTVDNGGLGVFNRALKIIGSDASIKGEVGKMILKVMTKQLKHADTPLTDDDIKAAVRPLETPDKGEGDYLQQARKLIELAEKDGGSDPYKSAAINAIARRQEQINYKTAAQLAAEAKAEAQAKIKKAKAAAKKKR